LREFPNWLKAFLDYAQVSETPFEMLYWSGVSAVAGALQRKVWVDQGRYKLYPNFFIVFVADPGVIQKSTTINEALALLRKVPDVVFAPDATTWEGFIKFMEDSHTADDAFTGDANQPHDKTAAVTIVASELSTFLDPTNKYMLSALTKLWDCEDTFVKLTKFSGTEHIEKPCVNLIGGTTPSWMRESFDKWTREGGFVSRTIFIYGDKKRQLVAFPKKNHTTARERLGERLILDLCRMNKLKGEYILHPEVFSIGETWYNAHNGRIGQPGYTDSSGFKDRKQSHILKLAMIIAAATSDKMMILPEHWGEALVLIDRAEKDFPKAFSSLDERSELRPYYELMVAIKKEGRIERSKLYAKYTSRYLLREMQAAIEAMVESGSVAKVNASDGKMYVQWIGDK
jgi:Protein of unknown function (DUF3987)